MIYHKSAEVRVKNVQFLNVFVKKNIHAERIAMYCNVLY